jgi:hypothetical protein
MTLTPALFNSAIKLNRRFASVSVKDDVGSSITMMRALVESALAISDLSDTYHKNVISQRRAYPNKILESQILFG